MEDIVPGESSTIKLSKQLTKLQLLSSPLALYTKLWHQQEQIKRLNSNYYPAESAFNFYINDKITKCLGGTVNIKAAKENFYTELFQHINLPRNYSFAPIIREINQTIERYTQQQFPITYTDKGKGRLQTPAVTSKEIQLPTWKKQRIESLSYLSYHHTPRSTINILSAGVFTPNNPITENPEFEIPNLRNQQNLNSVNLEVKTLNIQTLPTQDNQNPNLINQPNLPPQPLQLPPQQNQQLLQQPPQPPQPPNLDPMAYTLIAKLDNFTSEENNVQVWLNDVKKAITANRWNDAQAMQAISYFFKDTANLWYQSLINKPQNFNAFKVEFLRYFSNNNSINHLVNTFTTMKQEKTKAVTTYLGHFHRNLHQIQAIDANYFTAPQILNQFIHGLSSELDSKLKQFSDSINQKLEEYLADNYTIYQPPQQYSNLGNYNHSQNQALNKGTSEQTATFITTSNREINIETLIISTKSRTISKHLPANDTAANLPSTSLLDSSLSTAATSDISTTAIHNISTTLTSNLSTSINSDTAPKFIVHQLISSSSNSPSGSHSWNSGTSATQNPNSQNYLSLLVNPEDATTNNSGSNQQQALTNNILPATVTNDKLLMVIFSFNLEETIEILLFSRAALEEKPITTMYTDAKIDGHAIKLILDSRLADSIITRQLMDQLGHRVDRTASARIITADKTIKTPIGEIDNLPIKINGIMVSIKVFVMEATQY
ncbi:hypothetical protein G9A89_020962 [Geosiphon pyriformis]|nr:hypothetical protein G9A89_020962 [Geosiphon pyriformis]